MGRLENKVAIITGGGALVSCSTGEQEVGGLTASTYKAEVPDTRIWPSELACP